jgi:predicted nuclease of predicted toxin-antitoxin system
MRVLLDTCVWGGARLHLREAGCDVSWTGELPEDPGDRAILNKAHAENRVLITLDKDFGELAIIHRLPHRGIVRLVDVGARAQGPVAAAIVRKYYEELREGAIITVEPGRVRIRPPDS